MRQLHTIVAAAALLALGTVSAQAFGDKCYGPLSAKGHKEHSMRAAMEAAKDKWEKAADKKYGDDFDDWDYSGDRTISCSWDAPGRHFWCTASARPCGRHH